MYEHRNQPLLPRPLFVQRMLGHAAVALAVMAASLFAGVLGYRLAEGLPWLDALLNASMILGGMGPVNQLHTTAGKLFASCYALFSGVAFLAITGLLLAPLAHRLMHRMHMEPNGPSKR